jgi:hypothetical protein
MMSVVELNSSNPGIARGFRRIRIFCQLTRQSLPMRPTHWMQTAGSTPRSPCLGYFIVYSIKRLCTQHNNSEAQLEPGGLPTLLPYLLIIMFHGVSSILLSILITYLWDCSVVN